MKIIDPYKPDHPLLPVDGEFLINLIRDKGSIEANRYMDRRNKAIRREEQDPLRYGHKFEHWEELRDKFKTHDEICCLGGNRSSKTECAIDLSVDTLVNGPFWLSEYERKKRLEDGIIVAYFHSSSKSSNNQQQSRVFEFLPPQWRNIGKEGKFTNVSYTKKNGFSDDIFILPNGAMGMYFNYKQDIDVIEGYEFDFAVFDELTPLDWVDAVRFRLATKRGKMFVGFAPVHGYNSVVKDFQSGSRVEQTRPADPELFPELQDKNGNLPVMVKGCKKGEMPYRAQCAKKEKYMFWFHSAMNVYNPFDEIKKKCAGRSSAFKKIRAYGWCENTAGNAFPNYGPAHIVTRKKFNEFAKEKSCRYCITDPGGKKNWFIKWYLCTPEGWTFVYREWPDLHTFGEWALPQDKIDFKAGPAQFLEAGGGIPRYKKLILELEGWVWDAERGVWNGNDAEVIEDRYMDARFGGTDAPSGGEGTSIIDLMANEDLDANGNIIGPSFDWLSASGGGSKDGMKAIDIGIQMINDLLDYDSESPITALNCPKWYIVEDLLQTDYAYREFTGMGTDKDALKDVIDPDRYFVSSDLSYIDSDMMKVQQGGSY